LERVDNLEVVFSLVMLDDLAVNIGRVSSALFSGFAMIFTSLRFRTRDLTW